MSSAFGLWNVRSGFTRGFSAFMGKRAKCACEAWNTKYLRCACETSERLGTIFRQRNGSQVLRTCESTLRVSESSVFNKSASVW